ncbi:MAG: hypothetical protein JSS81_06520 [Acidobacteria bacterium]|nr:hypothetical protein [Acidobacteriota bacterium]
MLIKKNPTGCRRIRQAVENCDTGRAGRHPPGAVEKPLEISENPNVFIFYRLFAIFPKARMMPRGRRGIAVAKDWRQTPDAGRPAEDEKNGYGQAFDKRIRPVSKSETVEGRRFPDRRLKHKASQWTGRF